MIPVIAAHLLVTQDFCECELPHSLPLQRQLVDDGY
jgi:hypothetical protein